MLIASQSLHGCEKMGAQGVLNAFFIPESPDRVCLVDGVTQEDSAWVTWLCDDFD